MKPQEAKKLEKKVLDNLKKYLKADKSIIAAISGGPDSMLLLNFLIQTDAKVVVSHLDHNLRKESGKDASFIKKFCDQHALICEIKSLDIKDLAKKSQKGLEESGRIQRYKFFSHLAKKHHADYILTAHHADDNLETILLNFTRGAGLKGLAGMSELDIVPYSNLKNTLLLRPLLEFSKKEILEYLKYKKIKYLKDQSNKDTTISRNFLRHRVIPLLKKLNPNLEKTTAKNVEVIRESQQTLEKEAKNWLSKQNPTKLNAKSFLDQAKVIQKLILLEAYKLIYHDTKNIEQVHLEEAIKLIENNIGNKSKKLGKMTISIKNNIISLKK